MRLGSGVGGSEAGCGHRLFIHIRVNVPITTSAAASLLHVTQYLGGQLTASSSDGEPSSQLAEAVLPVLLVRPGPASPASPPGPPGPSRILLPQRRSFFLGLKLLTRIQRREPIEEDGDCHHDGPGLAWISLEHKFL